jgi:tetratricopeptide (TPR) repeat protein
MAFPKYALQLALALLMTFQFACTDEKGAGNKNEVENEKNTQASSNDSSQNKQKKPSQLAEEFSSKGKINDAIQVLSIELKKIPNDKAILYQLGDLYLQKGDTTMAISSIQQSIELGNAETEAIMKLCYILANKNDAKSLKYSNLLIHEINSDNTNHLGYFLRGIYFANIGNRKDAMLSFDKSIIENYRFIDAYIEKAILLYENNEFKKSIKLLEKGIEIDKFQADLYYWIGRNSEKLKNIDESIYAYEQTLALVPEFANAKFRLDSLNKIKNK